VDEYIEELKKGALDPYDELAAFGLFLQKERKSLRLAQIRDA
jgi:hypothetical protein